MKHFQKMIETKTQMCRGCLSPLDNSNFNSLFDSRLLGQKFQETTFIIVASNDGLPPFLCHSCTKRLEESFKFKTMCISSDFELKRRLWNDRLFNNKKPHLNGFSLISRNRRYSNSSSRHAAAISDSELSDSDSSSDETTQTLSTDQNSNRKSINNLSETSTTPSVKVRLKRLTSAEINKYKRVESHQKAQIKNNGSNVNNGANIRSRKRDSGSVQGKATTINVSNDWERRNSFVDVEGASMLTNDNQTQSIMTNNTNANEDGKSDCYEQSQQDEVTSPNSIKDEPEIEIIDNDQEFSTIPRPYSCSVCSKSFMYKINLTSHMTMHTSMESKNHECGTCSKQLQSRSSLLRHVKSHQTEQLLRNHLPNHISNVENDQQQQQLKRNNTANSRKTNHTKVVTTNHIECNVCKVKFTNKTDLNRHTRSEHLIQSTNSSPIKCNFCTKIFTRKSHLNDHLSIHTGEKPFKCPECSKLFRTKRMFYRHCRVHLNSIQCKICSKVFPERHNLIQHIKRRHENEKDNRKKPFVCELCSKGFMTKHIIEQHMKVHSNIRPFVCEKCFKSFKNIADLNRHRLIHGSKQFKCSNCGKEFHQKSNYFRHLKVHR